MGTLFCARGEGTCFWPSGGCNRPPLPPLAHVWPYCKMDCLQYDQKAICPTAKWTDCRVSLLQYGLTAICLYCNIATVIWPTSIWRRQNDAQPCSRKSTYFQQNFCKMHVFQKCSKRAVSLQKNQKMHVSFGLLRDHCKSSQFIHLNCRIGKALQRSFIWCPAMQWTTVLAWRIFATWSTP